MSNQRMVIKWSSRREDSRLSRIGEEAMRGQPGGDSYTIVHGSFIHNSLKIKNSTNTYRQVNG